MKRAHVLVIDNDPAIEPLVRKALSAADVRLVTDPDAALPLLEAESFDLVLAAVAPPSVDGLALLGAVQKIDRSLPVILLAHQPSVESVTAGLRLGAADYLAKPLAAEDLARSAQRVLAGRRLDAEHELLRRQIERPYTFEEIIGASPPMRRVYETIEQVAASNVDVLVLGATGTGKELVARAIHRRSRRAGRPFVPIDCGAIPDNLLESELFGHERGAFTGADSRRIGLLEFADGGTVFLDEIGELPLLLQAKLLRTLQERRIRRVGAREEVEVDVRVVAATARDLDTMVRQGLFRQDLYYRINVVRIDLPPLRIRGDDIGLLAEFFANRQSREMAKPMSGITPEAYQVLRQYSWPGNVRELQNVIRRAIALAKGTMIGLDDLPDEVVVAAGERGAEAPDSSGSLGYFQLRDEHVAHFERQYLTDLLTRNQGEVQSAAREAKLPRGTLYRLMKNHGLDSADFRERR
ncbi:MAG: sigma-54 dependent transcriptional regulator [Pirellulales bacterium]